MGFLEYFFNKKLNRTQNTVISNAVSNTVSTSTNIPISTDSTSVQQACIFSKDSQIQVFSEKNPTTGAIDYIITKGDIQIGTLVAKGKVNLREMAKDLSNVLNSLEQTQNKEANFENIEDLALKYNINYSRQFHHILHPDIVIDYKTFNTRLPKTIDIKALSIEELMSYGAALTSRISTLASIQTPAEAYFHKSSLESFMRSQESPSLQGALIAKLSSENTAEQLQNFNLILDLAKSLENIPNEDGFLYSAYLKLEEDRILSQILSDISAYDQSITLDFSTQKTELSEAGLSIPEITDLETDFLTKQISQKERIRDIQEILIQSKTTSQNSELSDTTAPDTYFSSVTKYIIDDNILHNPIDNYFQKILRQDLEVKSFLAFNPEIPNSDKAMEYLHAKMSSYGQVTHIPKKTSLRSFIETTNYKSPDTTESQNFLFVIAQIEKAYIENQYMPILEEYKKILDKQNAQTRTTKSLSLQTNFDER